MIAKMVKGKGFRGTLEYDLRQSKGYVLDSNMAGSTTRELAREFGQVRTLRPNLSRAVCHVSLALAPGESLSDAQWKEVAQKYLEHMGFTENQFIATRHTDAAHQHIHLLINRVTLSGEVVSDSHDYKRQESLMRRLEREYGLSQVTPSREAERKALTKGEIEHALRTEQPSVRMRLQSMVDEALRHARSLARFISDLADNGVTVKLNQAGTGRISGISFALDGVAMKGSDLGRAYTWGSLQKRGVYNEQTRPSEGNERNAGASARHSSDGPGNTAIQDGTAEPGISGLGRQERRHSESIPRVADGGKKLGDLRAGNHQRGKRVSR